MQAVGYLLQIEAQKAHGGVRDLYARSAFNRYYYGVFLDIRRMFAGLDPGWATLAHKAYPEVLDGKLTKKFKEARRKATKAGDFELVDIIEAAIRASAALAKLMERAYGIRVVADYLPEELVQFSGAGRFSLKSIDITEAHNWEVDVALWVKSIQSAWKQLHA